RAHGLLPEPGMHVQVLRGGNAAASRAPAGSQALDRRRGSFPRGPQASRVAAGGVDATAPDGLLTACSTEEYLEAILWLLEDPAARTRLARAGRARMLSHHAWS